MSEDQKNGEMSAETQAAPAVFEPLPEITEGVVTEEKVCEPVAEMHEMEANAAEGIPPEVKAKVDEIMNAIDECAGSGPKLFVLESESCSGEPCADKVEEDAIETEFWLTLDDEYDCQDNHILTHVEFDGELAHLLAKVEGLELVNKELSEENVDGARTIKAFIAYRKWVLAMAQRFTVAINAQVGWREHVAAAKRFAKELTEAAAMFDIGLTAEVETNEDKETKKEKQRKMLVQVYDMATQSLDPENFEALEKALAQLAVTRKIKWEPTVRGKEG